MDLGQISVDVVLGDRSLQTIQEQIQNSIKQINQNSISITVDHKSLNDLNAHLTLKQQHIAELNKAVVSPHWDNREILAGLNDVRKQLQGTSLAIKLDTSDISRQLQQALKSTTVDINVISGGANKEVLSSLKTIAANTGKSYSSNVFNGFVESVGAHLFDSLKGDLKGKLGIDFGEGAAKKAIGVASSLKSILVTDNEDYQNYLKAKQEKVKKSFLDFVSKIGDAATEAIDDENLELNKVDLFKEKLREKLNLKGIGESVQEVLNQAIAEIKSVNVFKPETARNAVQNIIQKPSVQSGLKTIATNVNEYGNAVFSPQVKAKALEPLGNAIRSYRDYSIDEKAIPLVQQRVEEILAGKRKSGQQTKYLSSIDSSTNEVLLAIGGYAGAGGLSGKRIAADFRANKIPGQVVNAIGGLDTDVSPERLEKFGVQNSMMMSMAKPYLRGYNNDAVEMAAQAVVALQKNPNLTVKALGESGGGFAAEEFERIMQRMGLGDRADYLGVGTPSRFGDFDLKTTKKLLSPDEYLGREMNALWKPKGVVDLSSPSQNILGVPDHTYENYKNVPQFHEFVGTAKAESLPPERIETLKKYADSLKNTGEQNFAGDTEGLETFTEQLIKDLNEVRIGVRNAVGDEKKQLQEIAEQLETTVRNFDEADPQSLKDIRQSVEVIEQFYESVKNNTNPKNFEQLLKYKNELPELSKRLASEDLQQFGTPKAKQTDLENRISLLQDNLSPANLLKPYDPMANLTPRQLVLLKNGGKLPERPSNLVPATELPIYRTQPDMMGDTKYRDEFFEGLGDTGAKYHDDLFGGDNIPIKAAKPNAFPELKPGEKYHDDLFGGADIKPVVADLDRVKKALLEIDGLDVEPLQKLEKQVVALPVDIDHIKNALDSFDEIKAPPVAKIEEVVKASDTDDTKADFEKKIAEIKNLTSKFKEAYAELKSTLKSEVGTDEGRDKATTQAQTILENTGRAKSDIEKFRGDAGIPKIGTREADQINQQLAQISTYENNIRRNFAKAKLELPTVDPKQFEPLGEQLNIGLAKGIADTSAQPKGAIGEVAEEVIQEFKNINEIASPSKVFERFGEFIVAGYEKGLLNKPIVGLFRGLLSEDQKDAVNYQTEVNNVLKEVVKQSQERMGESSVGKTFWESFNEGLLKVVGTAAKLGALFFGITELAPKLKDFIVESVKVADEFDIINRQVVNSSALGQGLSNVKALTASADANALDRKTTLQSGGEFLASTTGTTFEGSKGLDTLTALNQFLGGQSVNAQQQQAFTQSLGQVIQNGQLQRQDLQGFNQNTPGFLSVYARSQGSTVDQINRRFQQTPEGLNSDSIATAAQQAKAESSLKMGESLNTIQASTTKLDNSLLKLQTDVGNAFLPLQKFGLDDVASTIDLVSNNLGFLTKGLATAVIWLSEPIWSNFGKGLLEWAATFDAVAVKETLVSIKTAILSTDFKALGTQIMESFGAEFLLIQTFISLIERLTISFSDLSGESGKFADATKNNLAAINKELNKTSNSSTGFKFTGAIGRTAKDFIDRPFAYLNPFDTTLQKEGKTRRDTQDAVTRGYQNTKELLAVSGSPETNARIKQVQGIDAQLQDYQAKIRATKINNPDDESKLKSLQQAESDLLKVRESAVKPISQEQAALDLALKGTIENKKRFEEINSNGELDQQIGAMDKQIQSLTERISQINKQIGASVNAFDIWKLSLAEITIRLTDSKSTLDRNLAISRTAIAESDSGNTITPGQRGFLGQSVEISNLQQQYKQASEAIRQRQALITTNPQAQSVLSANGINSNTGIAKLQQKIDMSSDNNDKQIFQQFQQLQQAKLDLAGLGQQVSEAQQQMVQTLRDQTKQVADYFLGVTREIEQSKLEVEKINDQIKSSNSAESIRQALLGTEDGIVATFLESVAQNIEKIGQIKSTKVDQSIADLNARIKEVDTTKAAIELSRTLPGNAIKVPVDIDLSNAETLGKITSGLNKNFSSAKDLTGLISDGVGKVNDLIGQSTNKTGDLSKQLGDVKTSTLGIVDAFEQVKTSILAVTENGNNLYSVLSGVGKVVGTAVTSAVGLDFGKALGGLKDQAVTFLGSLKSPLVTGDKLLTNPEKEHHGNAPGQTAYHEEGGQEYRTDGGAKRIIKDYVLEEQGFQKNASVPSPATGKLRLKTDDPTGYGNYAEILDNLGRVIGRAAHLAAFDENLKDGDNVRMGQRVGYQGRTGHADGLHVHYETLPELLPLLVQGIKTGNWGQAQDKSPMSSSSGLSKTGQMYEQYLDNPKVTAFLKSIAIAEVGDTLVKKGLGYGKQIGGNYATEEFQNTQNLIAIPGSLPGRGGQNAFGRYQLHQADLDDAKSLGVSNLSPRNQDIIAVQRLDMRGALKPLLDGNIDEAIKKAGKEWASLEGSPYRNDGLNHTTEGGTLSAFKQNFNQALQYAGLSGGIQSPDQLQGVVRGGLSGSLSQQEQQRQTVQRQSQTDIRVQQAQAQRDAVKALQQIREAGRVQGEANKDTTLDTLNQQLKAEGTPTLEQANTNKLQNTIREYDKLIADRQRNLEKTNEDIKGAREGLKSTALTGDNRTAVESGLQINLATKKTDEKAIADLQAAKAKAIAENKRLFENQIGQRDIGNTFELSQQQINTASTKLDQLRARQQVSPLDPSVRQIPGLEQSIGQQQVTLDLAKQINDTNQKILQAGKDPAQVKQLQAQIEAYKILAAAKIKQIDLTYAANQAELESSQTSLKLAREKVFTDSRQAYAQQYQQGLQLASKYAPVDQKDVSETKRRNDQGEIEQAYKQAVADIAAKFKASEDTPGGITTDEYKGLLLRAALTKSEQAGNADELKKQSLMESKQQLDQYYGSNQSDLLNAKASAVGRQLGGNPFIAASYSRDAASLQENIKYAKELQDIEDQISARSARGIDTSGLEAVKDNLTQIHELNLQQIGFQFKTFGDTVNDVANQGLKSLSTNLTDVILKGGKFGDVFKTLAQTLLTTITQSGLSDLIGSLFGGNKGIPTNNNDVSGGLLGVGLNQSGSLFGLGGQQSSNPLGIFSGIAGALFGKPNNNPGASIAGLLGGSSATDPLTSDLDSLFGFASGGDVGSMSMGKLRTSNSAIGKALQREGSNSVLAALTPGERILTVQENAKFKQMLGNSYQVLNYKDGGDVGGITLNASQNLANSSNKVNNTQPVNVNASINDTGKSPDERSTVKAIRTVVVAELARQNAMQKRN